MFVVLIFILLLVWAAVIWSIYSNFLVFYSNFSETENYHRAYYASISALERWELVTKQREPGYVWSGGFIMWIWTWSRGNWWSDSSLPWFSYFWDNNNETSIFWSINSLTKRIPATWNGDVESMLAYIDPNDPDNSSDNYNMMDYENAEIFLLYKDKSGGNPYKNNSTESIIPTKIEWQIRLPALLSGKFWNLDTSSVLYWQSNSLPKDDAIVDRQIRWYADDEPFTIYSTPSIDLTRKTVNKYEDSVFRESDINSVLEFDFKNNNLSPLNKDSRWKDSRLTVISQNEQFFESIYNLKNLFDYDNISNIQLRFSLLNLVQWLTQWKDEKQETHVYPFLEYFVDFGWTEVPDKYYTITAEWKYKDYNVDIVVKKPTIKETILWSFISIF